MKQNEIAFKDFKKSITKEEFEAVLYIAEKTHEKLRQILEAKINFDKDIDERSKSMPKPSNSKEKDQFEAIMKVSRVVKKKSEEKIKELAGKDIENLNGITEFLNRFSESNPDGTDKYEKLDFSFLDNL